MSYIKHQRAAQPRAFSPPLHPDSALLPSIQHIFFSLTLNKKQKLLSLKRSWPCKNIQNSKPALKGLPSVYHAKESIDPEKPGEQTTWATLLHLSRTWEGHQGVGVDPDPQAVWSVWVRECCQPFYRRFPDQSTANLHGWWGEVHSRHTDLWTTKQEIVCSVKLVFPCY